MGRQAITESIESGDWSVLAENRLAFPEKQLPSGDTERMMIVVRKITLSHKRSGYTFWFSGQRRQGMLTFGDSRSSEKSFAGLTKERYNTPQLRSLLTPMIGADNADRCLAVATL